MSTGDEPPIAQSEPKLREVRYRHSLSFVDVLAQVQATLLVSTYQAGKLGVISVAGDRGVLNSLVVSSLDSYVEAAIRLASDPTFSNSARQTIESPSHGLFECDQEIDDLTEWFSSAAQSERPRSRS